MREIPYHHQRGELPKSLLELPLLAGLQGAGLDELLEHSSIVECSPSETIVREGEASDAFFILLRGQLRVKIQNQDIAVLREPGEVFGEMGMLRREPRAASVVSANGAVVLKVRPGFGESLEPIRRMRGEAVAYRFLAELLARRLAETSERLAEREREPAVYRL